MPQRDTTEILDQLSRGNWRVFTYRELLDLGVSAQQVRTMVQRGQLHRLHSGVYLYGHSKVDWQGTFLAAQYAGGDGAYLTRNSALALHRLWRPYVHEIHVCATVKHRSRNGVIFHRTRTPPEPEELRHDGPLTYAALPRLLVDLAPASNEAQLNRLITKAVQQDKLDHAQMQFVLQRYAGRPGSAALQAAYAGYLVKPRPKSELEGALDSALAQRPWIPAPERNVYIEAGGIRWEIDRFWPEHRLGVEVDSRTYHQALKDRAKDEFKRAKLLTIGIQTLSVSDWRIDYDISACLDDLEAILGLRRGGWGRDAA